MRIFRGECHYGHELLPNLPFGWRELFTRGIIVIQRKLRPQLKMDTANANESIKELLMRPEPCLISRFGTGELEATLRGRDIAENASFIHKVLGLLTNNNGPFWWDNSIRAGLCNNAGFFPPTPELMQRFSNLVLNDVKEIDILGAYTEMPRKFKDTHFPQALLTPIATLEPFWNEHPWTAALAKKKVLLIHSMPETICHQYSKRAHLFANPEMLPEFELITYKSVNSAMGLHTEFPTWFDALEKMESDISNIDFDIAILGCGAYGMNLGAFIKRNLRKKAIHLGGMTQLIFGIHGKRWDEAPQYSQFYNEYWTRPLPINTPNPSTKIESGCYW